MTPDLSTSSHQHSTPAPTQPEQVLTWLNSQTTPDHGEDAPPLPGDLLSDIQRTFGLAPEATPAPAESVGLWRRFTEMFSSRSLVGWSGTLAAACVVAMLVWQHADKPDGQTGAIILRGGNEVAPASGISWHWIGLEKFPAEQAKLNKENLAAEITNSGFVVTLDAQTDPLQVLVTTTKAGVPQPEFDLKLPKQAAPALRPAVWVNALQQLESKLQTSPP